MKKITRILALAAIVAASASCAKEIAAPEQLNGQVREIEFTASAVDAKTAVNGSTVTWKAGDVIKVYDSQKNSASYQVEADAATVKFSLTLGNGPYYAVSGTSESVAAAPFELADKSFVTTLPAVSQKGSFGDADLLVACDTTSACKLAFKHAFAMVKMTVEASDYTSVAFKSTKVLAGSSVVSFGAKSALTVEVGDDESKSVTVSGIENSAKTYYFAVLPGTYPGFSVECANGSGVKSASHDASITLAAGDVLDLGTIDSRLGTSYGLVSMNSFSEISGNIGGNAAFTYEAFKGKASTAPAVNSNAVRLYQAASGADYGGYITIKSVQGDKISSVTIGSSMATSVKYAVDGSETLSDAASIKANAKLSVDNLSCDEITFYCVGTTSTTRLYVNYLAVSYKKDPREAQVLSFSASEAEAYLGMDFTEPVLSGAKTTVTYSSSNTAVATVDPSTGAVTPVAPGVAIISADAAATESYKVGSASYNLTVAALKEGVTGIKSSITGTTDVPFAATLTNAVVTNKYSSSNPATSWQFIIEQDGVAVFTYYLAPKGATLEKGSVINGTVSGTGKFYNNVIQISTLDLSKATVTAGETLPQTVKTVAQLNTNFEALLYTRVKLENVTYQDGKFVQSTDEVKAFVPSSANLKLYDGEVMDVVVFPEYYYNSSDKTSTPQAYVLYASDVTYKLQKTIITVDAAKAMVKGDEWNMGATCNSTATLSYVSSDPSVASVDATGKVTALAGGTATITISAPAVEGFTAAETTVSISVSESVMKTDTLTFDFNDSATFPSGFPSGKKDETYFPLNTEKSVTFTNNLTLILCPTGSCYKYSTSSGTAYKALFIGSCTNDIATTSYIKFPAREGYKLTGVIIMNGYGCSAGVPINIYSVDNIAMSTAVNTAKGGECKYELVTSAANTVYKMAWPYSSAKNLHIMNLKLIYTEVK